MWKLDIKFLCPCNSSGCLLCLPDLVNSGASPGVPIYRIASLLAAHHLTGVLCHQLTVRSPPVVYQGRCDTTLACRSKQEVQCINCCAMHLHFSVIICDCKTLLGNYMHAQGRAHQVLYGNGPETPSCHCHVNQVACLVCLK